jgi:Na+-driven multidrug efflux pump
VGKFTADRLLFWGVVLGFVLGLFQLSLLPLLKVFTPLVEIQREARIPSIIGSLLQVLNGVVFIGEGIQQANQRFLSLAFVTILSTFGMLTSLHFFGNTLVGVWGSYGVFNFIRLLGVLRHHYLSGPLASKTINQIDTDNDNDSDSTGNNKE